MLSKGTDIDDQKENTLVLLLKEHNEDAFRQLVEKFQRNVYNVCLGLLKNEEDAEDATQDVFVEIYSSIEKFKGNATLKTWIYRITVNKSLELLRKNKRSKRFGWITSIFGNEEWIDKKQADFFHPGVQLENKERAAILFSHIGLLPENQKVAFTLHKVEGLSYQEIGDVMKTSIPSVESLMVRARKNLQQSLKNYYESELNNQNII